MNPSPREQSLYDHLDELSRRLLKCVIAVIVAACVCYAKIDVLIAFIVKPVGNLVFISPQSAFLAHLYLALLAGFLITFPYILYHVWQFVGEGLKSHERRSILIFGPLSLILFVTGILFSYFIAIPISMQFLLGFSSEALQPMITVRHYASFVGMMLLAFGVVFELPLILIFLTKIGIATPAFLIQKRKHAIILILILSALITPPDLITQVILAVPLVALYELGVIFSKWTYKKKQLEKAAL